MKQGGPDQPVSQTGSRVLCSNQKSKIIKQGVLSLILVSLPDWGKDLSIVEVLPKNLWMSPRLTWSIFLKKYSLVCLSPQYYWLNCGRLPITKNIYPKWKKRLFFFLAVSEASFMPAVQVPSDRTYLQDPLIC